MIKTYLNLKQFRDIKKQKMKKIIYIYLLLFIVNVACTNTSKPTYESGPEWKMHNIYLADKLCNGLDEHDLDNDGFLDYVTNFEDNGNIVVMFHPGKDKLQEEWQQIIIGNFPTAESACFGDVDGDGFTDAICVHGHQTETDKSGIAIIWNPGTGKARNKDAWKSSDDLNGTVEIGNYLYVKTFDVNQDGILDIIAGGRAEGRVRAEVSDKTPIVGLIWCEAPKDPEDRRDASKWETHDIDGDIISGHGFDFGDLDGDGDQDIVLANNDWGLEKFVDNRKAVQWYENPGRDLAANEWERHILYVDTAFYTKPFAATGDLNGDGALDFVTQTSDHVVYFQNNQSNPGEFERIMIPKDEKAQWRARPIKINDINRDGKMDIVIGLIHHDGNLPSNVPALIWMEYSGKSPATDNWKTNVIKWGDGFDGKGVFTGEKWDILTFSDVDKDGDTDIVANCEEYDKINVVWFENPQD